MTTRSGQNGRVGSLLIVTGPPGAGKSAVSSTLVDRFNPGVLVEGDRFLEFLRSGRIEPWLAESDHQNTIVTQAATSATGRFALGGFDVVYDGVVGPWFVDTFAEAAGVDAFDYAILLPPVEICVQRVATRSGHGFTDESATRHMHQRFQEATIDERHVLLSPAEGTETVAEVVIERRKSGALRRHLIP